MQICRVYRCQIGGAKSKETRHSTVTVGVDGILQLNSPMSLFSQCHCFHIAYMCMNVHTCIVM